MGSFITRKLLSAFRCDMSLCHLSQKYRPPSIAVCISVPGAVLLNLSVSRWTGTGASLTIALPALLACRVFRQLKLKAIEFEAASMPTLTALPTLSIADSGVLVPHVEVEDPRARSNAYEMADITLA